MGCCERDYYMAAPCPNCGKEDAARMGSTEWGHDHMCCSPQCGMAFRDSQKRWEIELEMAEFGLLAAKSKVESLRERLRAAKEKA